MSEIEVTAEVATPAPTDAAAQAGTILRAAREAQGLHIAALAVSLKVPVKKLEALEAGRYDELPDMVFVRSLALSVCRALKISPDPVLGALPGLPVHAIKSASNGLNTEFKSADASAYSSVRARLTSPMGVGAAALMVATAAVLLWQDSTGVPSAISAPESMPIEAIAINQEVPVVPSMPVQPQAAVTDTDAGTAANTPVLPDVIEFKAHGVSWIEVLDADGAPRLRKLTTDGEVLRVAGKLPLAVIVGRADQIAVQVRGQALDLKPLARENVARFDVR